jgi:isopentenyl diphosphate isomerase/L-lactate dehydrogenase-like FMN-dependent dehydrogenase
MSTSMVSKYNNHNDNRIITISISNSSNPSTTHQTYYEMTATDKLPLITKSVVTRIDIHHAGEETDQQTIRLTFEGSHV